MTSETIFVWVYLPGELKPVLAGRLTIEHFAGAPLGSFVYRRRYLEDPRALSLDPVSLPLHARIEPFTALKGWPAVILDALPDRWGMRAIDRLIGQQPYPSGYLLLNDPGRAGNLAFSPTPDTEPAELESREFPLAELLAAANALEHDAPVDPELIKALHPGTGGARPKCNVVTDGAVWIAKFPANDDPSGVSIPRLEHATMRLAAACGIEVAPTRLCVVDDQDVCLVRRFDREMAEGGGISRLGFISARSVFFADPGFLAAGACSSYARLARWLPRYNSSRQAVQELFRRMVFNCAVRNTDDHELNHALVFSPRTGAYELSPAYDLVPSLVRHTIHRHAMLIGDNADGSIENLLSGSAAFGLTPGEARAIIDEVQQSIQVQWDSVLYEAGFDDRQIEFVRHCFAPLPLGREAG